jgi:hypothetical protein
VTAVDPRLAFLACASARLILVEEGVMSLDEALDDAFIERFRSVAGIVCRCESEMLEHWEPLHPHQRSRSYRRVTS